jgi:hypothetical protein
MHFLKVQKKAKNASKKTPKNRVQNRPKSPKSPINKGPNEDEATIHATYTWEPYLKYRHLYLGAVP